jgi:hypothetical protein
MGLCWRQPGLVAGYHLSDVNDFSGNSKTLENEGTVTFVGDGFVKSANFVAASSQYLYNSTSVVPTNAAFSFRFRVKIISQPASGSSYILCYVSTNGGGTESGGVGYTNDGGTYKLTVSTGATLTSYTMTMALGVWYSIAFVVAGAHSSAISLYVNGSYRAGGMTDAAAIDFDSVMIGGFAGSFSNSRIDEVAIFNRALSAQEIRRWYSFQKGVLV